MNEEYTMFFKLYKYALNLIINSLKHRVIQREEGDGSLSSMKALVLNLSKFKSTEFRSKIVENIHLQNEMAKKLKRNVSS